MTVGRCADRQISTRKKKVDAARHCIGRVGSESLGESNPLQEQNGCHDASHGMARHGIAGHPKPTCLSPTSSDAPPTVDHFAALHCASTWCDEDACRTRSSAWRTNDERLATNGDLSVEAQSCKRLLPGLARCWNRGRRAAQPLRPECFRRWMPGVAIAELMHLVNMTTANIRADGLGRAAVASLPASIPGPQYIRTFSSSNAFM